MNLEAADTGEAELGERYLRIRFEDLCAEPEPVIARVLDFLELEGDAGSSTRRRSSRRPRSGGGASPTPSSSGSSSGSRPGARALRVPVVTGEAPVSAEARPQRVICVLGMHRSGTSCLAGSLEQQGLFLGDVNTSAPWNRRGNRERFDIMNLQGEILEASGGSWYSPPAVRRVERRSTSSGAGDPRRARRKPVWGFKDPRTVLTFDGWRQPVTRPPAGRHLPASARASRSRSGAETTSPSRRAWGSGRPTTIVSWRSTRSSPFPVVSFDEDPATLEGKLRQAGELVGLGEAPPDEPFFTRRAAQLARRGRFGPGRDRSPLRAASRAGSRARTEGSGKLRGVVCVESPMTPEDAREIAAALLDLSGPRTVFYDAHRAAWLDALEALPEPLDWGSQRPGDAPEAIILAAHDIYRVPAGPPAEGADPPALCDRALPDRRSHANLLPSRRVEHPDARGRKTAAPGAELAADAVASSGRIWDGLPEASKGRNPPDRLTRAAGFEPATSGSGGQRSIH